MRILQLSGNLLVASGGPTRSTLGIAESISDSGAFLHELIIIGSVDSHIIGILNEKKIKYSVLKNSILKAYNVLIIRLPKLVLRIRNSDVILVNGFFLFSNLIVFLFKKKDTRLIIVPHGSLEVYEKSKSKIRKTIFTKIVQLCNSRNFEFVVASKLEAKNLMFPYSLKRITVIPYGTDLPVLNQRKTSSSKNLNLLSFNRISDKKRIDISIRVLEILSRRGISASLNIIGSGSASLKLQLETLVQDLGLSEKVFFHGQLYGEELENVLRQMDILILPSENENFANSVTECIVREIPVIISSNTGTSDFVKNNRCGLVIDNLNASSYFEGILYLMEHIDKYRDNCFHSRKLLSWKCASLEWSKLLSEDKDEFKA